LGIGFLDNLWIEGISQQSMKIVVSWVGMMADEEHAKRKMDVFEIGIYAVEVLIIAAIVYAIIAFPAWLKPAIS
jgi:hypothetical protein